MRYGGFAKSVGMGVLTTPHGLLHAVCGSSSTMTSIRSTSTRSWAISVRANPTGDVVIIPNLAENLDPAGVPSGMFSKMIWMRPRQGRPTVADYGEVLDTPAQTDAWRNKLLP